ncbi:MAG: hypothetical protein ACI84K_001027 [Pseudohongiellaceae bacterium]|jgi:hypothetical protein
MTIKLISKIQHLLLVVAMLLNPIIASADVLFSDKNASLVQSTIASTINSDAEKNASCHDDNLTASAQDVNDKTDCCDDPCQCGASGCHTASATISAYKSVFVVSTYSFNHLRAYYLSFVSSPSSPPPIV